MICVSLSGPSRQCLALMKGCEMVELRLDLIPDAANHLRELFGGKVPTVATCRPGKLDLAARRALLEGAIAAGADIVDIEHDADAWLRRGLIRFAKSHKCRVMLSIHDFDKTPSKKALDRLVNRGFVRGADLVKVACQVNSPADAARLLGLLESGKPMVVVGMGKQGTLVRLLSPRLGSEFTFAAPKKGMETAPGQLDRRSMERAMARIGQLVGARGKS